MYPTLRYLRPFLCPCGDGAGSPGLSKTVHDRRGRAKTTIASCTPHSTILLVPGTRIDYRDHSISNRGGVASPRRWEAGRSVSRGGCGRWCRRAWCRSNVQDRPSSSKTVIDRSRPSTPCLVVDKKAIAATTTTVRRCTPHSTKQAGISNTESSVVPRPRPRPIEWREDRCSSVRGGVALSLASVQRTLYVPDFDKTRQRQDIQRQVLDVRGLVVLVLGYSFGFGHRLLILVVRGKVKLR
jgi:hypothetical protein